MDADQLLQHWQYVHPAVKPIETEVEHAAALVRYEQVFALQVADPGNTVIGSLLEVLGAQIHRFEAEQYVIPEAPPHQVLAYLMDSRGLSQSGLAREVHIDQGTLSKLLTGVRTFSKAHAKVLSRFFQVPVELFL